MVPLLGIFASSQVIGVTAAGFFLASTVGISPFNLIPLAEHGNLPPSTLAPLYTHMFLTRGRRAFLAGSLGAAAAFLTAYFNRPADISLEHSRALLGAAGLLIAAVPHTIIWMVPVYKQLGNGAYKGTEEQTKERWQTLMSRFYRGNSIRVAIFLAAYSLGIYGLTSSKVTHLV
ncbi:hypothetical protein R3P38DRAFT_2878625 [Favolaschia claudopus]|uniref:DUF1772-domain-containing protein n=1 Tax=Favolaschia claudopus TaxID=2862362 RepID=A0AAW0CYQ2_9AGAR